MKKYLWNLVKFCLLCGLLFPMRMFAQEAPTYTIDPQHSYVLWHINHFGFSNPSGKWFANGTLTFDEKNPQNSQVNITINLADIVTGNEELDKHLKSPEFFDVVKFPTATFKSDKVIITGKSTAKITGILNLHGVSKPVTLEVTFNKQGNNLITDKETVGFSAHAQLHRSDFGINTLLPGLSDEVKLDIEAEAFKAS